MSQEEHTTVGIGPLAVDRVQFALDRLKEAMKLVPDADKALDEISADMESMVSRYALSLRMGKIDNDALKGFFRQPYPKLVREVGPDGKVVPNAWLLAVPRFVPIQVGFLISQDESYNYFRVNRFMDWFGELPDWVKKQIGWTEPPDLRLEGEELVGSPEAVAMAWKEFRPYLRGREGDRLLVDKENAYELMVGLLKKGVKPFSDSPIDPADLTDRKCDYELFDYQKRIWETMLKKSSVGIFIPPSTGKTVIGVWAATHIKPKTLIVVPSLTLKEQWEERLTNHTDLKLGEEVVVATYYDAIKNHGKTEFTLKIYDEVHHLPANHFIKLSWLKAKYTIGLSATPYREDNSGRDIGGEEMIFALTGEPCLLGSSLVKTSRTRWIPLSKTSGAVISIDPDFKEEPTESKLLPASWKGRRPFKISTLGKSVVATNDHPFLIWTKEGETWIPASKIRPGDLIATTPDIVTGESFLLSDFSDEIVNTHKEKQRMLVRAFDYAITRAKTIGVWKAALETRATYGVCNTNWFYGVMPRPLKEIERNDRTYDVGWFYKLLGTTYGDASLDRYFQLQLAFHQTEQAEIVGQFKDVGIPVSPLGEHGKGRRMKIHDFALARLLYSRGLPIGSKQDQPIEPPRFMADFDAALQLRSFLSGLYGAEGSIRYRGGARAEIQIGLNTHRRQYLEPFFRWLTDRLDELGIRSHLSITLTKEKSHSFRLSISDAESLIAFIHLIPFGFSSGKQTLANEILARLLSIRVQMAQKWSLRQRILAMAQGGSPLLSLEREFGIPDSTIALWLRHPDSGIGTHNVRYVSPRTSGHLRWEEVMESKIVDTTEGIYDLQARWNQTFIANGFVVHNCGLSWQHFRELNLIKNPTCYVWVEKNEDARLKRLADLLKTPKKTIIFSDSLQKGEMIAARYGIPFVQGSSKERLKTLGEAQTAVVSRVGDEGVSLPELERVIEVSWLWGSRRQELQRFTRLLHGKESKSEGEAHVLMTLEEWIHDKKRFFSVMDRGFKLVIKHEGVDEKVVQRAEAKAAPTRRAASTPSHVVPSEPPTKAPEIPAALLQRLPGIGRRLEALPVTQRTVVSPILANPDKSYSVNDLSLVTGYSPKYIGNYGGFGKLVRLGFINREKGGRYKSAL